MRWIVCTAWLAAVAALAGCGKDIHNTEAVQRAVVDYLSTRSDLNMDSLSVSVASVSFRQDQADATVSIQLRGAGPEQGMRMRYLLERQGDRWVVKDRRDAGGGNPHGETLPDSGPHGTPSGTPGELPAGHPPIGGSTPNP